MKYKKVLDEEPKTTEEDDKDEEPKGLMSRKR